MTRPDITSHLLSTLRGIRAWTHGVPQMFCEGCGREIPAGESYVTYERHIERAGRRRVTVEDVTDLRVLHPACDRDVSLGGTITPADVVSGQIPANTPVEVRGVAGDFDGPKASFWLITPDATAVQVRLAGFIDLDAYEEMRMALQPVKLPGGTRLASVRVIGRVSIAGPQPTIDAERIIRLEQDEEAAAR